MVDYGLFPEAVAAKAPMNLNPISEGPINMESRGGLIAFDIEPFSPKGFPHRAEDHVVNFSLVMPFAECGVMGLSAMVEPTSERKLLSLLHKLLSGLDGFLLLTYNGSRFDIAYVMQRGVLYGLGFEEAFANIHHIDVYQLLRWLKVSFPKYDQKTVEGCLGIRRVIRHVSSGSYHHFYYGFLRESDLTPLFYNIEGSFGCLKIANSMFPHGM